MSILHEIHRLVDSQEHGWFPIADVEKCLSKHGYTITALPDDNITDGGYSKIWETPSCKIVVNANVWDAKTFTEFVERLK